MRSKHWFLVARSMRALLGGVTAPARSPLSRLVGALAGMFLLAASATAEEPQPPAATLAEFRFERRGEIYLPVTIGKRTRPFLLNMGHGMCALDRSFAEGLGPVLDTVGDGAVDVYKAPPMRLGPLALPAKSVWMMPPFYRPTLTDIEPVGGIVSLEALKDKIFTIDFDRGAVRFLRRAEGDLGTPVALKWYRAEWTRGALLTAVAEVEGPGKEEFMIDTGWPGGLSGSLRNAAFDKLLAPRNMRLVGEEAGATLDGQKSTRLGQVGRVSLGRFAHEGLVFADGNLPISTLRLGYLSRYMVTFDMPRATMYLRPGKEFNRADYFDLSGLTLLRSEGKVFVSYIEAGSAAEAAGLKRFDVILSVDGVRAIEIAHAELARIFATPGERRVVFEQDLVQKQTTVVLKDPLQRGDGGGGGGAKGAGN